MNYVLNYLKTELTHCTNSVILIKSIFRFEFEASFILNFSQASRSHSIAPGFAPPPSNKIIMLFVFGISLRNAS